MNKAKRWVAPKELSLEELAWAMFEKVTLLQAQEAAYDLGYEIVIKWKDD